MSRPAPAPVDLAPDLREFLDDVVEGLSRTPKRIPCKYLYDEEGSRLFEEICALEEYYPTRTEIRILERHGGEMAELLGPRCLLVEYGSGSSVKTRLLLDRLAEPAGYVPIDISREHLMDAVLRLRRRYPILPILPVVADYTSEIALPRSEVPPGRKAGFFPGSTIGNFEPAEARAFLGRVARAVGSGGGLLIGVDLVKDPDVLQAAYDDAAGVTAAFNRNVLERLVRELQAECRPEEFEHVALWNADAARMEMHLESRRDQTIVAGGRRFVVRRGERIWTESSHKYTRESFDRLARSAGFTVTRVWTDERDWFSVQFLTVRG